ncbi:hypothetical protein [Candidatus Poriferisodalis sp.]
MHLVGWVLVAWMALVVAALWLAALMGRIFLWLLFWPIYLVRGIWRS